MSARINGKFAPGVSGNPGGRKPGPSALHQLEAMLAETVEGGSRSKLRELLHTIYTKACAGDMTAARIILDRVAPVRVALEGPDEGTLVIVRDFSGSAGLRSSYQIQPGETAAEARDRAEREWAEQVLARPRPVQSETTDSALAVSPSAVAPALAAGSGGSAPESAPTPSRSHVETAPAAPEVRPVANNGAGGPLLLVRPALSASEEEREARRWGERPRSSVTLDEVLAELDDDDDLEDDEA